MKIFSTNKEKVVISDADVPSGNGGINREGYTYGQLRHQPIVDEVLQGITNPKIREWADECNARNAVRGFEMFKIDGEYSFYDLRVGPVLKTPDKETLLRLIPERPITAASIRSITYEILRKEVAAACGLSMKEAENAIGNQLDCAPHEDISGCIFMVPNWAHKWFRHNGFVHRMLQE